jgi:hypothetical protein
MVTRKRIAWGAAGAAALLGVGALAPVGAEAIEPSADLSVSVAHDPSSATTGDEVTITVTAHNDGPDAAADVLAGLSFQWPLQFVDASDGCSLAPANNSVVCTLGDVASGTDGVATVTVRPMASGLYTLPVAVSSSTADPDTADRQGSDALIVQKGPSQGERYVAGTYPLLLDRPADAGALAYWGARFKAEMNAYPRHLEKIPAGIMASDEYRRLRIREAYQRILGRAADPGALTYWVARAKAGLPFLRIEQILMGSNEFARKTVGGSTPAVFQAVLGRAPSGDELSKWSEAAPGPLARILQGSVEGRNVIILDLYQSVLGHAPDVFGHYSMLGRLRDGVSPERLWAELLVSWEYLAKFPATEDDYTYDGPILDEAPTHDFRSSAPDLAAALDAAS